MENHDKFVCSKCHLSYNTARGLSLHCNRYCDPVKKSSNDDKPNFQTSTDNGFNFDVMSFQSKKAKLFHNPNPTKFLRSEKVMDDNNMEFNIEQHSEVNTSFEQNNSTESNQLLQQSQLHARKSKDVGTSLHALAEVDLLKILSDLNCHNIAYDRIISWASFWNSRKITFQNSPSHIYRSREVVLKSLSKKHDMEMMRPILSKIDIDGTEYHVTSFDFQQQILSLLRDEDLMQPKNLVLENDPTIDPCFPCEKISEINHSDWYYSTHLHYNKIYGKDSNRLICGIIFAIDKTHTDTKGKLCLESVNFTLSLFNTETRRNNHRAWRSLGFINDLNTKFTSTVSTKKKTSNISGKVSFMTYIGVQYLSYVLILSRVVFDS